VTVSTELVFDDSTCDSRLSSGVAIESYPLDIESLDRRRVRRPGVRDDPAEKALEAVLHRAMSGADICIETERGAACCLVARVSEMTGAVRILGRAARMVRGEMEMGAIMGRTAGTADERGLETAWGRSDCQ